MSFLYWPVLKHYITVGLIASRLLCCFILGPGGILSKKYEYYLEDNPKIYAYKLKFQQHFTGEFVPPLLKKVHKHEIIWNFLLPKSNPYMPFEKSFASFPSIFARISMFEHFCGDWAYAEPNFLMSYPKNFFSQNLQFGPIRWFPRRFLKILII